VQASDKRKHRKYAFDLTHAFYAVMGGFVFDTSFEGETGPAKKSSGSATDTNERDVPTFAAFVYIMKYFPHIIPDISEESIMDRAETSNLMKAILVIQVGWFCTSCISRISQSLPLSLLEVSTAAHGFYTLLTIFIWYSKPLNIAEGTKMKGEKAREVHALLRCSRTEYELALRLTQTVAPEGDLSISTEPELVILAARALRHSFSGTEKGPTAPFLKHSRLPTPRSYTRLPSGVGFRWMTTAVAISPVLYGLVHMLGWNTNFPTPLECLAWRVSSIAVISSGIALWRS